MFVLPFYKQTNVFQFLWKQNRILMKVVKNEIDFKTLGNKIKIVFQENIFGEWLLPYIIFLEYWMIGTSRVKGETQ